MYGNYSRRGLIKMNTEYDEKSDGALKKFLDEDDHYEKIRPIEQVIEHSDAAIDKLGKMTGAIPKTIADKISSSVANFVDEVRSEIEATDAISTDDDDQVLTEG